MPTEICEEYVHGKQHTCNYSKDEVCRTKCDLEGVYLDVCGLMQVDSTEYNMYFDTFIGDYSRKL